MERRHFHPLQTHVWAGDVPHQITQDGESIFHHRCIRCGRDFVEPTDGTGWQAAHVGVLRIELLADSVTERWERWVGERMFGRLLTRTAFSTTRQGARLRQMARRLIGHRRIQALFVASHPVALARRPTGISERIIAGYRCARRRVTSFVSPVGLLYGRHVLKDRPRDRVHRSGRRSVRGSSPKAGYS